MKTYSCLAVFLCAFGLVQSHSQYVERKTQQKLDDCLKQEGLTEDALDKPNFNDPKIQCLVACIMYKTGRFVDGKVSVDKEIAFAPKYMPEKIDDSFNGKMTECVNRANKEKDTCSMGGALYKCAEEKFGHIPL